MAGVLVPVLNTVQYFTNQGAILAGGKIYTYLAGTTTPLTTYPTSALTGGTENANPIVLDSAGRLTSEAWVPTGTSTKIVIKDSTLVTLMTFDNLPGLNDTSSSSNATFWAGNATGTVNAITLTVSGITAYATGQTYSFIASGDNTSTVTLNVNSIGPVAVRKLGTTALATQDIKSGEVVTVWYDGTNFQKIAPNPVGRLLRTTMFASSGTWTRGSDVRMIFAHAVGGGGGGGGCSNVDGTAAGGGGSGGWGQVRTDSPASSYTITIGAGGAAGSNSGGTGGGGGTTSIGALLTATNGVGGTGSTAASTVVAGGAGGTNSTIVGEVSIWGGTGGGNGISTGAVATSSSGHGARGAYGGGAVGKAGVAGAGIPADANSGAGGSGAIGSSGGGQVGGAGGTGVVIIWEYS